jgi:hypothetical protein
LKKKHPDLIIGFDLVAEEIRRNAIDLVDVLVDHIKIQE